MTCIVGMVDKQGKGHIAADKMGSNGHNKSIYKNTKVFKKGDMLLGYTSSYRMGQILEHKLELPERKHNQDIYNYMYVDFTDTVRNLMKENGYAKVENNHEEIGVFMIITEGKVFVMQNEMSMLESEMGIDACGSGADFALAAIKTLIKHGMNDPKRILTEAIEIASEMCTTVGGGIIYLKQ